MRKIHPVVEVGDFLLQVKGRRVVVKDAASGDKNGRTSKQFGFEFDSCTTQAIFTKAQAQHVLMLMNSLKLGPYDITHVTPKGLHVGCTRVTRELAEEVNKLL